MMNNFGMYRMNIDKSIQQIDGLKSLYNAKKLSMELK